MIDPPLPHLTGARTYTEAGIEPKKPLYMLTLPVVTFLAGSFTVYMGVDVLLSIVARQNSSPPQFAIGVIAFGFAVLAYAVHLFSLWATDRRNGTKNTGQSTTRTNWRVIALLSVAIFMIGIYCLYFLHPAKVLRLANTMMGSIGLISGVYGLIASWNLRREEAKQRSLNRAPN